MRIAYFLVAASLCGCDCGTQVLNRPICEINPSLPQCQPAKPDAGPVQQHPPPATCQTGQVAGVICAPDEMTYVSGATVTVTGVCDGKGFTETATTSSTGQFTLTVPAGSWNLTASSGSFTQTFPVTVTAGQTTTESMDQQYCFKPTVTNLAVIDGSGDKIESLLTQIGFTPTIIDGSTTGFDSATGGLQFLKDPTQLAQYNVLFIDCGAGRTSESFPDGGTGYDKFNFGADAQTIADNLVQFVKNGGSLYASDWAFIFVFMGYPAEYQWETQSNISINFPFDPYDLMGAPNQVVMADVVDTGLAAYLGKSTVPITFPSNMDHWGLMSALNTPAVPLLTASVAACSDSECNSGGTPSTHPIAGLYQVTSGPGGAVAYTSFHNINQTDPTDVENILKYLIFKL